MERASRLRRAAGAQAPRWAALLQFPPAAVPMV